MSFNGADFSPAGSPLNPSNTLGGSQGTHEITPADIAVIVGAVVVFTLIVFGVFYYRHLRARREREQEDAERDVEMESASAGGKDHRDEEDLQDGEEDGKREGSVWRYGGWKGADGKEEGEAEEGTERKVSAVIVVDAAPPTKPADAYHAVL
ncbi:hypothetical protein GE09DRAFT_1116405, partial [Coniochaeta sp. 2T2.1]